MRGSTVPAKKTHNTTVSGPKYDTYGLPSTKGSPCWKSKPFPKKTYHTVTLNLGNPIIIHSKKHWIFRLIKPPLRVCHRWWNSPHDASSFTFSIFSFASLSLAHSVQTMVVKQRFKNTKKNGSHTGKWKCVLKVCLDVTVISSLGGSKRNVSHADQLKETEWSFVNAKKWTTKNNEIINAKFVMMLMFHHVNGLLLIKQLCLFCLFSQLNSAIFLWMETAVSSAHIKVVSWVVSPNPSPLPVTLFRIIGRWHVYIHIYIYTLWYLCM